MKKILLLSAAVLFAGTAAFADPPDQPGHQSPAPNTTNDTVSAVKDATGHAVGVISAEMTTKVKDFVGAAAVSDMYEVEAAKIAEQRSGDAKVKAFAHKMIAAHTQSTDKLKATLASAKVDITPPANLDDRRQGMIDELRGAKDTDFDGRYMSQQIDAHNEALILMRGYAKDGDVAEVKTFAAKMEPVVQGHIDMAKKIYGGLKKQSS
jgi:putative membrane protein